MSAKINKSNEAAATAKFNTNLKKSTTVFDQTHKSAQFLKDSAAYASTPGLQQAVTKWETSAAAVQTNDQEIINLRTSLIGLTAGRVSVFADWKRATKSLLAVVNETAKGSPKAINEMGFDISTRMPTPDHDLGSADGASRHVRQEDTGALAQVEGGFGAPRLQPPTRRRHADWMGPGAPGHEVAIQTHRADAGTARVGARLGSAEERPQRLVGRARCRRAVSLRLVN